MSRNKTYSAQPIFVIKSFSFNQTFDWHRTNAVFPNLSLGTFKSLEDFNTSLDNIKFDENDEVLVSKVMEMLNDHYTNKLIGYVNDSLEYFKYRIYHKRTIRSLQQI